MIYAFVRTFIMLIIIMCNFCQYKIKKLFYDGWWDGYSEGGYGTSDDTVVCVCVTIRIRGRPRHGRASEITVQTFKVGTAEKKNFIVYGMISRLLSLFFSLYIYTFISLWRSAPSPHGTPPLHPLHAASRTHAHAHNIIFR